MKRYLMGAAMLAMMAASCQNEQLVEQTEVQQGELFTLEVGKSFESRTVLNGTATHWCEDDAIYVSGDNGNVHGVLKFKRYGSDKTQAVFEGYVSGGQPSELEHIVFPVPQGGKIDMSKRNPGKLDAPMIGTIGNGEVQTLNNVGGLLTFNVDGGEGNKYGVTATTSGGENMTGGYYEFDAETGTLKYTPADIIAPIEVLADGSVYIPVATTIVPTLGDGNTEVTVDVDVVNLVNQNVISENTSIMIKENQIFGDEEDEKTELDIVTVSEDRVDTKWYNDEETEFEISTTKQLVGFAKLVNEGTDNFEGKTIRLAANIELDGIDWAPVGNSINKFRGAFDGCNKEISNLYIKGEYCSEYYEDGTKKSGSAFILEAGAEAVIENVVFRNVKIESGAYGAGVVCFAEEGIFLSNIKLFGSVRAKRAGGIGAWLVDAKIEDVENNAVVEGEISAGGITNRISGTINNSINKGNISGKGTESTGGIAGTQLGKDTEYNYCFNYGNVTTTADNANSSASGILGHTPSKKAIFVYCVNYGNILAEKSYAAGIGYSLYGSVSAEYCYNAGAITGDDGAGGIAPKAQYGNNDKATACLNAGKLTSKATTYQGSNKNKDCYYYTEDKLMSVSDNSEVEVEAALDILNGGENKEFFVKKDGKIIVKQ